MSDQNKWPVVTADRPCRECGKAGKCIVSPDGQRWYCNRFQRHGEEPNRPTTPRIEVKPKPTAKDRKIYKKLDDAIVAARLTIKGATEGGRWTYCRNGEDFAVVARFNLADGSKQCRPFTRTSTGWYCGKPEGLMPLYRQEYVSHVAPVITLYVAEGEKCADAVAGIGLTCVTSQGGSGAADKSDWRAIGHARTVVILADRDDPGEKYAAEVAKLVRAVNAECVIKIVRLEGCDGTPTGFDVADWIDERDSLESDAIRAQLEEIAADAEQWIAPPPGPDDPVIFDGITAGELIAKCPDLREVIIDGLLRRGETMNVISAPKIGKSWLVLGLLLSLATGRPWMGFELKQCDVLLIDNELHRETLARRIDIVGSRMGIPREEWADKLVVQSLRGRLKDWYELRTLFASIPPGRFGVIVCDAFYRFMPSGSDENDNGGMAAVYNLIDAYAAMTHASMILVHHSTKGIQAGKAITDVGAGAGAQSRATDTHLILRQHQADDAVVMEAAVRSFKPLDAVCLRWSYPLWSQAPDLDPSQLRTNKPRREKSDQNTVLPTETKPPPEPWTVDRFVREFIADEPRGKSTIIGNAELAGVTLRKSEQLFKVGIETGRIFEWTYAGDKRRKSYANVAQPILATVESNGGLS